LTPSDFTKASRYLRELKESVQVLEQEDVAKYFHLAWTQVGRGNLDPRLIVRSALLAER